MSEKHTSDTAALTADIRRRELARTVAELVESTDVKRRARIWAARARLRAAAAGEKVWERAILAGERVRFLVKSRRTRGPVRSPGEADSEP